MHDTFASQFQYVKKKIVQNWAPIIIYQVCFDENKQTDAFFTGKLSGPNDLPESVSKWVSQSSARYRKYQTKTIFQQMISICETIPKRLLAHLVFIPNKYLIFRGAIRFTKPFHYF